MFTCLVNTICDLQIHPRSGCKPDRLTFTDTLVSLTLITENLLFKSHLDLAAAILVFRSTKFDARHFFLIVFYGLIPKISILFRIPILLYIF